MIAAFYGHDKTVEALVEAGADLKMKDDEGQGVCNDGGFVLTSYDCVFCTRVQLI